MLQEKSPNRSTLSTRYAVHRQTRQTRLLTIRVTWISGDPIIRKVASETVHQSKRTKAPELKGCLKRGSMSSVAEVIINEAFCNVHYFSKRRKTQINEKEISLIIQAIMQRWFAARWYESHVKLSGNQIIASRLRNDKNVSWCILTEVLMCTHI